MSNLWIIILFSAGIIALFMLAMSLTLIIKGHHIESEISENRHMRERGIKCVIQETRELDGETSERSCETTCAGGDCSSCTGGAKNTSD